MKGTIRLSTRYAIKSKAIAKTNVITTAPRIQHIASAAPSISVGKVPVKDLVIAVGLINPTHLRCGFVSSGGGGGGDNLRLWSVHRGHILRVLTPVLLR